MADCSANNTERPDKDGTAEVNDANTENDARMEAANHGGDGVYEGPDDNDHSDDENAFVDPDFVEVLHEVGVTEPARPCTSDVYTLCTESIDDETLKITLWDVVNKELLWSGHASGDIMHRSYCPSANKVFATFLSHIDDFTCDLKIWDLNTGNVDTKFGLSSEGMYVPNHAGTKVIIDGEIGHINIWTTAHPLQGLFSVNSCQCKRFCFSGDDSIIIGYDYRQDSFEGNSNTGGTPKGKIYEWNANTGEVIFSFDAVSCFSSDRTHLISSVDGRACAVYDDSIISVLELTSGRELFHQEPALSISKACFGVSDSYIIIAFVDHHDMGDNVSCWNLDNNELLFGWAAKVFHLEFSPSTSRVYAVNSRKEVIQVMDGCSGVEMLRLDIVPSNKESMQLYCSRSMNILL
jgi:WD40 repeat protein